MMKKSLVILIMLIMLVPTLSCSQPRHEVETHRDRITQASVASALMVGRFEGVITIGELLSHGNLGLGTLDQLDGELIILEGEAFQVRGDGAVLPVSRTRKTPFAVITPFENDGMVSCPPSSSLKEIEDHLDRLIAHKNHFLVVRIDAVLDTITVRSVPRQTPPYQSLAEAARGQKLFNRQSIDGTLIAVRSPAWVGDLTVPGYHWHFLSRDRSFGGHVLDCKVSTCSARFDICDEWTILFEADPRFDELDLTPDFGRDLNRVERSHGGA